MPIIKIIIQMISIPSSEASVERNFSKRKRLQTHSQQNSSLAFLVAKLQILTNIKKSK
jgi:hypothetical protein